LPGLLVPHVYPTLHPTIGVPHVTFHASSGSLPGLHVPHVQPKFHPIVFHVSCILRISTWSPRSSRVPLRFDVFRLIFITQRFRCSSLQGYRPFWRTFRLCLPFHFLVLTFQVFTFIHIPHNSRFTRHPGFLPLPVPHVPHVSSRCLTFLTFHVSHFNNRHTTRKVKT
jgi:hypothetical protein